MKTFGIGLAFVLSTAIVIAVGAVVGAVYVAGAGAIALVVFLL